MRVARDRARRDRRRGASRCAREARRRRDRGRGPPADARAEYARVEQAAAARRRGARRGADATRRVERLVARGRPRRPEPRRRPSGIPRSQARARRGRAGPQRDRPRGASARPTRRTPVRRGHRHERQDDGHDADGRDARGVGRARASRPATSAAAARRGATTTSTWSSPRCRRSSSRSRPRRSGPRVGRAPQRRPTTISTGTARFDAYAAAKARIFAHQTADDLLVFDADDAVVAAIAADAPGRRVAVLASRGTRRPASASSTRPRAGCSSTADGTELAAVDDAAPSRCRTTARTRSPPPRPRSRSARPPTACATRSASFASLPHRVAAGRRSAAGCSCYDDSKATNPARDARRGRAVRPRSCCSPAAATRVSTSAVLAERRAAASRAVVAFGEAADEVAAAFARARPGRDRAVDARRGARRGGARRARRRRAAVARVRVVRRVRRVRRARRRLRRARSRALDRRSGERDDRRRHRESAPARSSAAHADRRGRRRAVARPTAAAAAAGRAYVRACCATVAVLNIVGLVMILSASSVAGAHELRLVVVLLRAPARLGGRSASSRSSLVVRDRLPTGGAASCAPLLVAIASAMLVARARPGRRHLRRRVAALARARVRGAFQPSEIAKLALLLFAARPCSTRRQDELARLAPRAAPGAARARRASRGLVMLEPDLDSTIVLALIGVALLVVGGVRAPAPRWRSAASGVVLVDGARARGAVPAGAHVRVPAPVARRRRTPATRSRSR